MAYTDQCPVAALANVICKRDPIAGWPVNHGWHLVAVSIAVIL
jgi:hypothetical protein